MAQERSQLNIPVATPYGKTTLHIVPVSKGKLYEADSADISNGLQQFQLVEGNTYQYQFDSLSGSSFQIAQEDELISYSKLSGQNNSGTINTGIYVGIYNCKVRSQGSDEIVATIKLEIRSVKTDYVSDYREMLSDIAETYADLVLQQGAPITQLLETDEKISSQTLYQRFCFVRGIIESDSFNDAMHKIVSAPVRKWSEATAYRTITGIRKMTRKNMRELASASDRISWSCSEDLCKSEFHDDNPYSLTSLPRRLQINTHVDSTDNAANQFVKFALRQFEMFCSDLYGMNNASDRLKDEVSATRERINNYLDSQFFRLVSDPTHLTLNSPVLQRKEGYREVFQKWLLFDLAAKLNWSGGDDVYEAGKKNVATLYEYWLFLKLKDLISCFFNIDARSKEKLVTSDINGINLNLCQGRMTVLRGISNSEIRKLNVAFYYNRTFGHISDDNDQIHKAGSWTMDMCPDYTLSIWPGEIEENKAERLDLITHIHFDAKYRLNQVLLDSKQLNPASTTSNETDVLSQEKIEQERGCYKRADLLKMHAYKDAIRRTSGAYILYPGTENRTIKGFHEVLPGLGAFHVRPGKWEEDSEYLKSFIREVKAHMLDRTSEREKLSFFQYDILREPNPYTTRRRLPELDEHNRDFRPDDVSVIIAYVKSPKHLEWILSKMLYNMRAGSRRGSMALSDDIINAKYLLLHDDKSCQGLIKIKGSGPKVFTYAGLIAKDYPKDNSSPKDVLSRIYLVYSLDSNIEEEYNHYSWDIDKKWGQKPRAIKLSELLRDAHFDKIPLK